MLQLPILIHVHAFQMFIWISTVNEKVLVVHLDKGSVIKNVIFFDFDKSFSDENVSVVHFI